MTIAFFGLSQNGYGSGLGHSPRVLQQAFTILEAQPQPPLLGYRASLYTIALCSVRYSRVSRYTPYFGVSQTCAEARSTRAGRSAKMPYGDHKGRFIAAQAVLGRV